MAPVMEIAFLPLRPGVDINDTSISEGKVMANMVEVGKHAPGVLKNYWGVEEENSAHVHLMLGTSRRCEMAEILSEVTNIGLCCR